METLTKKSKVLTCYLEDLLHRLQRNKICMYLMYHYKLDHLINI
jgi:hypothetical protein